MDLISDEKYAHFICFIFCYELTNYSIDFCIHVLNYILIIYDVQLFQYNIDQRMFSVLSLWFYRHF